MEIHCLLKNRIDNLYKKFIKLETEHESIIELENERDWNDYE